MINQKMVGGRESCAAKATFVPWALQSKGAEALDEGSTTGTTISIARLPSYPAEKSYERAFRGNIFPVFLP
ncbi:hypothetical protein JOD24_001606 [Kroppenstedtia sanguinis]